MDTNADHTGDTGMTETADMGLELHTYYRGSGCYQGGGCDTTGATAGAWSFLVLFVVVATRRALWAR